MESSSRRSLLSPWLLVATSVGAIAAATTSACGSNDKGGTGDPLGDAGSEDTAMGDVGADSPASITLRIDPPTVALTVPIAGKSGDVALKVFAKDASGTETDVTDKASFSIADPTLAIFTGSKVGSATRGGKTTISASMGASASAATATLTVQLTGDVTPTGFDPATKAKFDGATVDPTPANQPVIEYPLAGAVVPRNVPPMEVQWKKGGDSANYRVRFSSPDVLAVDAYGTTLEAILDSAPWSTIVDSAAGAKLQMVVEGLGATGLHRSEPVAITVARDRIDDSAIYYWESSSGSLHALDFTAGKNAVLPVTGSKYAPGTSAVCVACHTVSRDGTRFSYTVGDFSFGTLAASADKKSFAASIEPGTKVPTGFKWTYAAFDPKEAAEMPAVLVSKADAPASQNAPGHVRLELLHPDTGAVITSNLVDWLAGFPAGIGRDILQPDWSPAGFVVFASYDSEEDNPDAAGVLKKAYVRDLGDDAVHTSIVEASVAWDSTKKAFTFGAPKVLVKAKAATNLDTSETDVLPQISPDDSLVAFTRSDGWWSIRLQSDAVNGSGRIAVVRRADGNVVELANASGPADSNSTWPQWAPTAGTEYMWVAFSSERPYGHRMAPGVAIPDACKPQGRSFCKNMWVAAVDKKLAMSGTADPSAVPFWLPGQTALASAVSPRWTKAAVGGPAK